MKGKELQQLWDDFYVSEDECNASIFETSAKKWVTSFALFYQRKDVTPYMHAMAFHVPQFLSLYDGNISIFNQQGLEKLNDVMTKHFQRGNHYDISALKQILQKHICLQTLEEHGYQIKKNVQKCTLCATINALILIDNHFNIICKYQ